METFVTLHRVVSRQPKKRRDIIVGQFFQICPQDFSWSSGQINKNYFFLPSSYVANRALNTLYGALHSNMRHFLTDLRHNAFGKKTLALCLRASTFLSHVVWFLVEVEVENPIFRILTDFGSQTCVLGSRCSHLQAKKGNPLWLKLTWTCWSSSIF